MTNSCEKGKRGEREFANLLSDLGFDSRRGQQHAGGSDSPDVICEALPWVHWEVKFTERTDMYGWLDQSARDAGVEEMPVVAHRKKNAGWVVILDLHDFLYLTRFVPKA